MSAKWNLIVDVERCDNCRNCFLATKDEHIGNDFPGYAAAQPEKEHSWVDIRHNERGAYPIVEANFMPVMCNHCDDAPCMKVAKNDAVKKREDGIVIIDPEKSKGQKGIVDACPYGAVYWNEDKQIPQAWFFDAHLLDEGWTKPRVQQSCPTDVFRALQIDDSEMQRIQAEEGLDVLLPEEGTKPRIYYKNLHLMNTCFVSGSVVADIDGVEECAEGVEAILSKDGKEVGQATTDVFGEFKIDKLEPGSGTYSLSLTSKTLGAFTRDCAVGDESLYLGILKLEV
jgi:Fe-S-cluster-containing dehydrogenase component